MNAAKERVRFHCLGCDGVLLAAPRLAGRQVRCPKCQAANTVPSWNWNREGEGYELVKEGSSGLPLPPAGGESTEETTPPPVIGPPESKQAEPPDSSTPGSGNAGAAAQEFVPVVCHVCSTRMSATLDQVGQKIECPDCGCKCIVRPPPKKRVSKVVLQEGSELPVGPAIVTPEIDYLAEAERRPAPDTGLHSQRQREQIREEVARNRGKLWGLLVGYWVALSVLLVGLLGLILGTASFSIGSMADPFLFIFMSVLSAFATLAWVALVSMICQAIMQNAAEGSPLQNDLPDWYHVIDWILGSRFVVWALLVAGVPGGLLARLLLWLGLPYWFCLPLSLWTMFPPVLVSILVTGSLGDVFSNDVWRTYRLAPLRWLQFYAESLGMAVVCGLALYTVFVITESLWGMLLAAPVWMGAAILYFRRLGLLVDSLQLEDDDSSVP